MAIFQLKHGWAQGKVRVRGQVRVTMTVLCSALAVNLRRTDRYLKDHQRQVLLPGLVQERLQGADSDAHQALTRAEPDGRQHAFLDLVGDQAAADPQDDGGFCDGEQLER